MKQLSLAIILLINSFQTVAQNAQFEKELTALASYASIPTLKGAYLRTEKEGMMVYECTKSLFGFETSMGFLKGTLAFTAGSRQPFSVSAKDVELSANKGIDGFTRIDDAISMSVAPPNTDLAITLFNTEGSRSVSFFILPDSSVRIIIADKPGFKYVEYITLTDKKTKKVGFEEIGVGYGLKRIKPIYDVVNPFSEGMAAVNIGGKKVKYGTEGGKWGFINEAGKEVIDLQYDAVSGFYGGLSAVRINGSYGYINKSGTMVIPAQFTYAGRFKDGIAEVTGGGEAFSINWFGERLPK